LELLKKISNHSSFNDFFLVGGTALALQIGHRISVDLDFFSENKFNQVGLSEILIKDFDINISNIADNTIIGSINNVKVDFLAHQYPSLEKKKIEGSIKLASLKDIAAMKINAVRNRGTKKDFVDIYFLLQEYSLKELLEFTNKKYPNHTDILTLKSLIYFEDADTQPDCDMLIDVAWEEIKKEIIKKVLPFLK